MTEEMQQFIRKLAELCTEYKAELWYTTHDDGIHIKIGEADACIGFPLLPDPGADILETVKMVPGITHESTDKAVNK